jgi:hypothetical protein
MSLSLGGVGNRRTDWCEGAHELLRETKRRRMLL